MSVTRLILYPLSLLYGIIIWIRNKLYDYQFLSSKSYDIPVIAVGNLSAGGTGKTPHVEYIIRRLKKQHTLAILSRGYKRKSAGFVLCNADSTYQEVGDEPLQYKRKYPSVIVAVDEKRVNGIDQLIKQYPDLQIILLDDAYQHRKVKPGLNILLTPYDQLYVNDHVIPSGRLREWPMGSDRADIVIVTKCPYKIHPIDKRRMREDLNVQAYQELYFSSVEYDVLTPLTPHAKDIALDAPEVLLVTGIAQPEGLLEFIQSKYQEVKHVVFPDHHSYSNGDINKIKTRFEQLEKNNTIIITTEKDSMRLLDPPIFNQISDLPIYFLPIRIKLHDDDEKKFDAQVMNFVKKMTNSEK